MILKSFQILIFHFLFISTGIFTTQSNHGLSQWSSQQTIPGYHQETWPPILLADQNRTVHAFSSQWLGDGGGNGRRAIVYNRWTLDQGWNEPIDILLPQLKDDARLTSAVLDQEGIVHIVFMSGDNTQANMYYSQAPVLYAGKASAWSEPSLVAENVQTPENGAIFVRDSLNLGILFAGSEKGNGIYASYSNDSGEEWSDPVLILNTSNIEMMVTNLKLYQGKSGQVHAVWNEITSGGQGRGIYFTTSKIGNPNWTTPIKIAEAESGYGTNTPAIIENNGEVYAFYNLNGIMMRRSLDGGANWSTPLSIFSRHVGVNGSLSPVIDSKGELHLFFGQRITGNPDIHGMWHSMWDGNKWSEPEAIVSGPGVADQVGEKAFDPYEASAVVSQGNLLLVTWRSDPGLKGNGVWYSFKILDAPELPIVALPPIQLETTPVSTAAVFKPTPTTQNEQSYQYVELSSNDLKNVAEPVSNPNEPLAVGIVPTILSILIISGVIAYKRKFNR